MSASFLISYGVLWLLVLTMGYMLLQGRAASGAKGIGPLASAESQGLPIGALFPFSAFFPPSGPTAGEKPVLILIAAIGCISCKPLLKLLPQWLSDNPKVQVIVLMVGTPERVAEAEKAYGAPIPFYPTTVEQMRAIQTTLAPFAYVVSREGRVLVKGSVAYDDHLTAMLQQAFPEVA